MCKELCNLHYSRLQNVKPAGQRKSHHGSGLLDGDPWYSGAKATMSLFQEAVLPQIFISTFDEIEKLVSESRILFVFEK